MIRRIVRFVIAAVIIPKLALAQVPGRAPQRGGASKAPLTAPLRLVLAPTGNAARFIVREKLFANTVENDAIGSTSAISGAIVLDNKGKVDTAASRITVQLDSLKSDQSRRDGYIKGRTLETQKYPTVIMVVRELRGLPATLPTSGTMSLTIIGDLIVHGVTKAATWTATVTADATGFAGTATTHVKFEDFNMNQPSVPVLAHVDDDIRLEYDFHFVKQ